MKRRAFLGTALSAILLAPAGHANTSQAEGIRFHFYGAEDCPPCMAFKRDHLADVQSTGRETGFSVTANIITRTADVPVEGIYGSEDPILRTALGENGRAYPPIFFVSKNGNVSSTHAHDWKAALDAAVQLAKE